MRRPVRRKRECRRQLQHAACAFQTWNFSNSRDASGGLSSTPPLEQRAGSGRGSTLHSAVDEILPNQDIELIPRAKHF
jgi:hypothetical protein